MKWIESKKMIIRIRDEQPFQDLLRQHGLSERTIDVMLRALRAVEFEITGELSAEEVE